ncbi:GntR family transcriptional regulator [Anaerotignum sp.]|uniref:GntR family transcriptional regulator n=1 Tax=Anaerotignum sp. TaxID=2039241 RepID=UPI002897F89D|nr:GntR family transcriptional regulator [Anaerotignum sp.]
MPSIKLQKSTMKDQVYEIIKEMILNQTYHLGEKINIDTLATELNVSNSPIREALTMLEKQGLVEYVPNVGSRIISFSPTAFREICFSLFTVVYGAYELCLSQNKINIAIEKMRQLLQVQKDIEDHSDMQTSIKYALAFDKSIVYATQNTYLLSIYEQMEDIFFLMALHINQRNAEEHQRNIFEHSMILESIEKNDIASAKHWFFIHYDKHV